MLAGEQTNSTENLITDRTILKINIRFPALICLMVFICEKLKFIKYSKDEPSLRSSGAI